MSKPLAGIKVIEVGQLLAGPFAGSMLAYFGAEVIKVEPPGGDPIRGWRELNNGTSYWWYSLARNKKSVCVDLKQSEGQALLKELLKDADVLVENFRPGVMEDWALGPEDVKQFNPALVYARISGYGQNGPNAKKPGFASVCEAYSGFRHVNGFPGEAPVRPNLSIGDTIAGIHAALGIALALIERQKSGEGQTIDVALYEAMFNLLEAVVPEYSGANKVREASGTTVTGIVPTNTYRCADSKFVVIGGNGDSIFKRLMSGIGHPDLAADPRLANNAGRVEHEDEIDQILSGWCSARPINEVLAVMAEQRVPAGPIYNVEDMLEDPHYQARGMFERVEIDGKPLDIPAILPKLDRTPGGTEWVGPGLGEHNDEVLRSIGISGSQIDTLLKKGVIE